MINGVIYYPDETIESYKNYISSNSIFKLYYSENIQNNDNDNDNNSDNGRVDECYIDYGNNVYNDIENIDFTDIKKESYRKVDYNLNFIMEINIEFFRTNNNIFSSNYNGDLFGLLKLCLLKEIAKKINFDRIQNIPIYILNILTILKIGALNYNNVQEGIVQTLKKINGGNIINFSKYVDGLINQYDINNYLIRNLDLNIKNDIMHIQNCLGKYNEYAQLFEKELNRAKKNSVFEYNRSTKY